MTALKKFSAVVPTLSLLIISFMGHPAGAQDKSELKKQPEIWARLELAGDNKTELILAIDSVSQNHEDALKFLILNMTQHDLKNLSAEFLLTNIRLAYKARSLASWEVPDDIFFNDVLPYANIDEPRDPWRKEMFELCESIVKECKSPGEAAQKLNATVFRELSVKYSTARKRANQSPAESIEQGLASCTGLSIILVDACRSVGVPARLVGIPSWKNKRGNHTWVEVWDDGWHFTGAAEPNKNGLNRTWFQADAALADPNSKMHSIYAVSFRKTKTDFPMVWSPEKKVYAENVTARYLPKTKTETAAKKTVNVMVRVWNADKTKREIVDVEVFPSDSKEILTSGKSKAGTADMNDMLAFDLKPATGYQLRLTRPATKISPALKMAYDLQTNTEPNQLVEVKLTPQDKGENESTKSQTKKDDDLSDLTDDDLTEDDLTEDDQHSLAHLADEYFFDADAANKILRDNPEEARKLAWDRYLHSPMARKRQADFDKNQVTFEKHLSPYTVKEVGKRPKNGWPLFIAMHGGGGAPQRVNDSQWKHMQIYYKDQQQVTGYKYLALRAPNNTWNGFYDDYVYPLIENLIQQFVVFGDVDPNKVFIMGYSHGGYGAFAIGPKIPYRFAAVHASAAAPTDGQTAAKTLRNTRFTFMVGEKDNAYGRRERCEKFAKQIEELGYSNVEFLFQKGIGHGGLPDREMIGQMYDNVRNPAPKHLTWEMTDSVVDRFYWLSVDEPKRGKLIDAKITGNRIKVQAKDCKSFSIFVDGRLLEDPGKPIEIVMVQEDGERSYSVNYKPSFKTLCKSIAKTGDINLAFDCEIKINLED